MRYSITGFPFPFDVFPPESNTLRMSSIGHELKVMSSQKKVRSSHCLHLGRKIYPPCCSPVLTLLLMPLVASVDCVGVGANVQLCRGRVPPAVRHPRPTARRSHSICLLSSLFITLTFLWPFLSLSLSLSLSLPQPYARSWSCLPSSRYSPPQASGA